MTRRRTHHLPLRCVWGRSHSATSPAKSILVLGYEKAGWRRCYPPLSELWNGGEWKHCQGLRSRECHLYRSECLPRTQGKRESCGASVLDGGLEYRPDISMGNPQAVHTVQAPRNSRQLLSRKIRWLVNSMESGYTGMSTSISFPTLGPVFRYCFRSRPSRYS